MGTKAFFSVGNGSKYKTTGLLLLCDGTEENLLNISKTFLSQVKKEKSYDFNDDTSINEILKNVISSVGGDSVVIENMKNLPPFIFKSVILQPERNEVRIYEGLFESLEKTQSLNNEIATKEKIEVLKPSMRKKVSLKNMKTLETISIVSKEIKEKFFAINKNGDPFLLELKDLADYQLN